MRLIIAPLAVACLPALAAAQTISIGQTINGELTPQDPAFQNGSHYRAYALQGSGGTDLSINLSSDHFDANVVLLDANGNRVAADDDSGGACNALLNTTLPESGTFQVLVNTSYPREVGRFELAVREGSARPASQEPCAGFVQPSGLAALGDVTDETLGAPDATLPDGSFYDSWIVPVPADQPITVELASTDFDAHLTLMTARGDILAQDDNGAGACNARVVHSGSEGYVRALVRARDGSGAYALNVTEGAAPINYRSECGDEPAESGGVVAGFGELPDNGRVIGVSGTYLGELTEADPRLDQDQTRVQAWSVMGEVGEDVTIDLVSDEFDSYLMVYGPGLRQALADDDGAGGCNARVSFTLRSDQPYRVIVNHAGTQDTGSFEIRTTTSPSPPADDPCTTEAPPVIEDLGSLATLAPEGGLFVGDVIEGTLDANDILHSSGSYVEAWTLAGTLGETVTVTLRSTDFDAFLYVLGPGIQGALRDDDSAGGCDARITVTFPQSDIYRVILTTSPANETGAFTVSLRTEPEPNRPGLCGADR